MNLKIKNFALFKNQTSFDLAPLTLLIGENSSGKSTFLKALDISHGLDFRSNFFDLDAVREYIKSNTQFEIPTFKNVHLRLNFKGFEGPDESHGYIEPILEYVDSNSNLILKLKFDEGVFKNQQYLHRIEIIVDLMKFRDMIINYHNTLGLTKEEYDNLKKLEENWQDKDKKFISEFNWLFEDEKSKQTTLDSILKIFNLAEDFDSPELIKLKFPIEYSLMDGQQFQKLNNNLEDAIMYFVEELNPKEFNFDNYDEISKAVKKIFYDSQSDLHRVLKSQRDIFRASNLGKAERLYTKDHPFFSVLQNYIYDIRSEPTSKLIAEWFLNKWMNRFFSSDIDFDIKILKDRKSNTIAFEYELGSKDLVEWGTGAYRVIYLIYLLAGFLARYSYGMGIEQNEDLKSVLSTAATNSKYHRNSRGFLDQSLIIFEEPEMNLHPDYQSYLAEMFFDFSNYHYSTIVIETHSEYMIRSFQYLRSKESSFSTETCSIINFGAGEMLGSINNIKILEDGSLTDSFYSGFMNHSQQIELKLLIHNRKIGSN